MLTTGPRLLAGDLPSTLLPSWPNGAVRTDHHEHKQQMALQGLMTIWPV